MIDLVCMEDGDIPTGRRGRHVERRLLHAGAAVQRTGKRSYRARDNNELIDLLLAEVVVWAPESLLFLHDVLILLLVLLAGLQQLRQRSLELRSNPDGPAVSEQSLLVRVEH